MIRHAKTLAVLACGAFAPAVWAADALTGEVHKQPLNVSAIAMFVAFVAFTLGSAAFLPTSSGMAERTGAIWEHPSVLLAYLTRRAAWMGLVAWVAVVPVSTCPLS